MIVAITSFRLPQSMPLDQAREVFLGTSGRYQNVPGLIRKYYALSPDGGTVVGAYLWRSKADAEAMYTPQWMAYATEKYGEAPKVDYYDCPVVVDNLAGTVTSDKD